MNFADKITFIIGVCTFAILLSEKILEEQFDQNVAFAIMISFIVASSILIVDRILERIPDNFILKIRKGLHYSIGLILGVCLCLIIFNSQSVVGHPKQPSNITIFPDKSIGSLSNKEAEQIIGDYLYSKNEIYGRDYDINIAHKYTIGSLNNNITRETGGIYFDIIAAGGKREYIHNIEFVDVEFSSDTLAKVKVKVDEKTQYSDQRSKNCELRKSDNLYILYRSNIQDTWKIASIITQRAKKLPCL